jgi:hypothetical protein
LIVKLAGLLQVPHFFFEVNQRKPNRYWLHRSAQVGARSWWR